MQFSSGENIQRRVKNGKCENTYYSINIIRVNESGQMGAASRMHGKCSV
jgi:hypothetical protein